MLTYSFGPFLVVTVAGIPTIPGLKVNRIKNKFQSILNAENPEGIRMERKQRLNSNKFDYRYRVTPKWKWSKGKWKMRIDFRRGWEGENRFWNSEIENKVT